jgi:hypothetical protein
VTEARSPRSCPRCGVRYPPRLSLCPRCLSEAELPPARLGESLELVEEIGRGGMGSVWKARHLALHRTVAVKFLSESLAGTPEFARRFEGEAQALARLSHPGIVAVHDFGREGENAFIVMEYVDGRPLSSRLPLPEAEVLPVALQVLDALAYAHAHGVVHRDVKPDNILVEASGRVKVTDFGIARILADDGTRHTLAGRLLGTPAYMAPEALAGGPPDPRMDVYSMGVVLYEALSGHLPAGDTGPVPGPLGRIVRKAMERDPARRYASAGEMRTDLAGGVVSTGAGDLPPEERYWLRAAALVQTLATAVALWAFTVSVTPRFFSSADLPPLTVVRAEHLPDGRLVSRARFEIWPTLSAVAALALALAAQAMLRRHWRQSGLEAVTPDRPLPESRSVLACGIVALALYGLRLGLEETASPFLTAVPILGGLLELATVFFAWMAVLEAWRTQRPLRREAGLWLGLGLALIPPAVELGRYVQAWRP